jgi:hypothetical protein
MAVLGSDTLSHSTTFKFNINSADRFTIDSSGRLLVNTSSFTIGSSYSDAQRLSIAGNSGQGVQIQCFSNDQFGSAVDFFKSRSATVGTRTIPNNGDALGSIIYNAWDGGSVRQAANIIGEIQGTPGANSMPGRLTFNTTAPGSTVPTQRMRITSQGFVEIGDIPLGGTNAKLIVSESVNSLGQVAYIENTNANFSNRILSLNASRNTTNNSYTFLVCSISAIAQKLVIFDNGNVQNSNNSYGQLSDIKLKENIVDATPKLEELNKIRIVNFNFKDDTRKQIGVIAQEIEQIFPTVVENIIDRDEKGNDLGTKTKSVKYSIFVPMLIKAIQELKLELENVKIELENLK